MKVLSLFDGISCGMVALERAGIPVERYVAYEIEPNAIKISKKNYPQIEHCGDVTSADFTQYEGFDLLIGGSPCQSLSIVQSKTREHLDGKSKLFFEFVRAKEEMRPKWFLFENVASMNEESKEAISRCLGCEPIFIDSADFSAQERPRFYWTNIPVILQYEKSTAALQDIMETEVDESFFYNYPLSNIDLSKQVCATMEYKNHDMHKRIFNPKFKCHTLTTCGGGNTQKKVFINGRARKLTPLEYERLQTLPDNYTIGVANSHRYNALGNGWTVDVIAHILSYIKERRKKEMELKIYNPTEGGFIKAIEWNHEEIKKEVSEKVEYYKNLVYTDDQIKEAKADRATLNKFVKALDDKRKEIKSQCLAPYEAFEKQMKEIIGIVNEPISLIDSQVKGYEERAKQEKETKIHFMIDESIGEGSPLDFLEHKQIFDTKWLNASVSLKSIQEEVNARLEQVKKDLDMLSELPEFGFEAAEVYKSTLDVNKAVNEAKRMSDMAKAKAAHEAEMKARAEEQARMAAESEAVKPEPVTTNINDPQDIENAAPVKPAEVQKQWISFSALLSKEDALALKEFFNSRNIEFKSV